LFATDVRLESHRRYVPAQGRASYARAVLWRGSSDPLRTNQCEGRISGTLALMLTRRIGIVGHGRLGARTVTGMRRALVAVVVVACLASAAGCGSAVAPRTWVTSVCQSLQPWRAAISNLNATAQTQMASAKTPADTRTHVLVLLNGARAASEKARADVAAAGTPDVDNGADIEKRFVASLAAVRDAYGRAATTVRALPAEGAPTFYTGVRAALAQLTADYNQAGADPSKIASTELQTDFGQVAACR
jgi:hypothetical protein